MPSRFLYCFCTILSLQVHAQILPFSNYNVKDGLVSSQIVSINRDNRGILWIGTPFGINWFDGHQFTEITVPARAGQLYVTNFVNDASGAMWILTFYNGIYKFENNRFRNFLIDSVIIEANANSIMDMVQYNDSTYLVVTDQDVYWFNGEKFKVFDESNPEIRVQINAVSFVNRDLVLFGNSKGLFIYEKQNGRWTYRGRRMKDLLVNKIYCENGKTWIATSRGLRLFNNTSQIFSDQPAKVYFEGENISTIVKNKHTGEYWAPGNSLYKFEDEKITSYSKENGLPVIPGVIFSDKENIMWMGSAAGLTKLVNEHYRFNDLLNTNVNRMITSIIRDDGYSIWLGTYGGLAKKDSFSYKPIHYTRDKKTIGFVSWMNYQGKENFYAGTEAGIVRIENNEAVKVDTLITSRMFQDADGSLLLSTIKGTVHRFRNGKISGVKLSHPLPDFIDGIYKDAKDNLWLGYRGSGIRKFRSIGNDQWELVKEYSTKTGYPNLRVRCIFSDKDGNMLFGTRTNGVFIVSGKDDSRTWQINSDKGLTGNWIKSIAQYGDEIYVATNKGVNILTGDYQSPFVRRINIENEDITEETTFIYPDRDKIWIGTEQGLLEYFPHRDKNTSVTPAIYFTKLSINGKADTSFHAYSLDHTASKLDHKSNVIAFEFAGIDMNNDEALEYSYRLEGQDKTWSDPSSRNFVSYNLLPGNYKFLVKVRNSAGVWSEQPASYSFQIATPFWKEWWFAAGITIAVITLLFLIYRYRVQQALKFERLRSKISTDLHDDIGSTLSSISILSEMALNGKNTEESVGMMQEIKQNSVSLMEKMDDIVWSINPRYDTLENLLVRIKSFAARLFEAKNVEYTITIDESVKHARLSMESRQHIYLMLKEAINNTVKYSDCTRASINVEFVHGLLKIVVKDNGKGFDMKKVNRGNGLLNMQNRAQLMQADIEIGSIPGEGTTIRWESKIK